MTKHDVLSELRPIFHPETVALIGASSSGGKVGRMFMERFVEAEVLMGSGTPVYPDPVRAVESLAKLAEYSRFRKRYD